MNITSITDSNLYQSTLFLSAQLLTVAATKNLLGDRGTERGEVMLSDSNIPTPRPATILAWASLCSFGPSQGYYDSKGTPIDFNLREGYFLVPFLPAILFGEDTTLSLARTAKAHKRNVLDKIEWGSIYIGDSSNGEIVEIIEEGHIPAQEWTPSGALVWQDAPCSLPPLWADWDDGWQFGIIQSIAHFTFTPREAMTMLSQHGIPSLRFINKEFYIRRLLFRFLSLQPAKVWAYDYASALREWTQAQQEEDVRALADELTKKQQELEESKQPAVEEYILADLKASKKEAKKKRIEAFDSLGFFDFGKPES